MKKSDLQQIRGVIKEEFGLQFQKHFDEQFNKHFSVQFNKHFSVQFGKHFSQQIKSGEFRGQIRSIFREEFSEQIRGEEFGQRVKGIFQEETRSEGFKEGIRGIFQEEFGQIWENNLSPVFDGIHGRLDNLEGKVDRMPDKAYLDEKLAGLSGNLIVKLRKEDEKVNCLTGILKNKDVLDKEDINLLKKFKIFPQLKKAE